MQKSTPRRAYPRARADLTFRPVEGQFALTDPTGRRAQLLNLTAALVWTYCDGQHRPEAIAAAIAQALPEAGDRSAVHDRVVSLLDQFASQGMLS